MGNGLSQNEIDALLGTVDDSILSSPIETPSSTNYKDFSEDVNKSKKDLEDINNFLNFALTTGMGVLSELTEEEIALSPLKSNLKDIDKVVSAIKGKVITISQTVKGALNGDLIFIFEEKGILKIVEKMLGQEETVLSDIALSTLGENFNKMLKAIYTWIKNSYKSEVEGEIPRVNIFDNPINMEIPFKQALEVSFSIRMDKVDIPILLILPVTLSKEILNLALKGSKDAYYTQTKEKSYSQQDKEKQIDARPVQFSRLDTNVNKNPLGNIEILLDVSMQVTVELGRTKMRIREILGLGEGSIIELQKLAGEPVDILVNAKLIAKGEVVVIDEYFGVRITEIISNAEMVNLMSLKDEG